jgi:hypothetical protein
VKHKSNSENFKFLFFSLFFFFSQEQSFSLPLFFKVKKKVENHLIVI